jgi:hypothetical protein
MNNKNGPHQRMTRDGGGQSLTSPGGEGAYERWQKSWRERIENPDDWERRRTAELRDARLARAAQEAASSSAWAACFHRPRRERDAFSLDEISRDVRLPGLPGQAGFDDATTDRILIGLFATLLHHDFDGNVLTWSDELRSLIPLDPESARWVQEWGHDGDAKALRTFGFAHAVFLTRAALKQWCEHNGLVMPWEWIPEGCWFAGRPQ